MDRDIIMQRLEPIFQDALGVPGLKLTNDLSADDVEAWDSMSHVSLVVEVESCFNVRFMTSEIEELHNVGEFVELIAKKLGTT